MAKKKKNLHSLLLYAFAYWYSFTTHGHWALKATEHQCTADDVLLSMMSVYLSQNAMNVTRIQLSELTHFRSFDTRRILAEVP